VRVDSAIGAALLIAAAAAPTCAAPPRPGAGPNDDANRCATCHMPEYVAAKSPVHAGTKPTTCAVCHGSESWHPSRLDHPFWALTGAHQKAGCFACHRGTPPTFHGTSTACVGCHRADFDRSTFPGHAEFPLGCDECHSTGAWKPTKKAPPARAEPSSPAVVPPDPIGRGTTPSAIPGHKGARPPPAPTPKPAAPDVVTTPSPHWHH
jgi:hypothetical protein